MNKTRTNTELIARRGELLAELFLQDLQPEFVARPVEEFGYDFFAGFSNPRGGVNVVAVEVKSTEQPSNHFLVIPKAKYARWANSNIPVLLHVVDVKANDYFFAWPDPEMLDQHPRSTNVKVPLTALDDHSRGKLRNQLTA
jgi:hypothetical protein